MTPPRAADRINSTQHARVTWSRRSDRDRPQGDPYAAVLWYDASAHSTTPVVAEFSFRHPAEATQAPRFTATEARAAYRAFRTALDLDAWIAPRQQTKTAYVHER